MDFSIKRNIILLSLTLLIFPIITFSQNVELAFSRVVTIDTTLSCPNGCSGITQSTEDFIVPPNKIWKIQYLSVIPDDGSTLWNSISANYKVNGTDIYYGNYDGGYGSKSTMSSSIWLNSGDTLNFHVSRNNTYSWSVPCFISILEFSLN